LSILVSKNPSGKKKLDSVILIAKICIIIFSAYSVTANLIPFFEGSNPFFYGVNSVLFGEGKFSITNDLLRETKRAEFIPENWLLTDHGTAVPMSGTGLMIIGSLFYIVGGYYGLLYLSPIFYILLLIASERISTKLFGSYVGLVTLLIVSSSNLLFRNSIELQTESVFSLFLIIGVFYLIKFLKTKNNYYLLLSTIIFTLTTWIRLNGLISMPLEILIISTFFLLPILIEKKRLTDSKNLKLWNKFQKIIRKLKKKKSLKVFLIVVIPWSFVLISYVAYYEYNFGDALGNYGEINESTRENYDTSISSIFKFEYKDYENVKQYSKYLLPYQIPAIYNKLNENFDNFLGNNWVGLISIVSLLGITTLSFYTKDKRTEIFVLMMFIVATVWFFSSITSQHRAEGGVPGRYMLPVFILSSMIFGYFLQKMIKKNTNGLKPILKILIKISKMILIIILGIFFIFAFYFSNPIQIILEEGWQFKNPEEFIKRYPLNLEGLTKDSIVISNVDVRVVEYGIISFNPMATKQTSDSINLLENMIKEGYDVYTFKIPFTIDEKNMINSLINDYEFTLKDYSKTFCKLELSYDNAISDEKCTNSDPIRKPKQ